MIAAIVICLCISLGTVRASNNETSFDNSTEDYETCMKNLILDLEQRIITLEGKLNIQRYDTTVTFNKTSRIYTGITCHTRDGKSSKISCPGGGTIEIVDADYGRSDNTTCSAGVVASGLEDSDCYQPKTKKIVTKKCEGQNSCIVPVAIQLFGDPCYGTSKYLTIRFKCIQNTEKLWNATCSSFVN